MDTAILVASVIGFIIWLAIIHEIIRSAVKSGTKRQARLQIMWMVKNGMDPQEIKNAIDLDEGDFWKLYNVKK